MESTVRVHPSIDGRNLITLELRFDPNELQTLTKKMKIIKSELIRFG